MGLVDHSLQSDARHDFMVDLDRGPKKASLAAKMSLLDEESRIRHELEIDVERGLEEEIKDGIHRLALRLHRLYQHKKERVSGTSQSTRSTSKNRRRTGEKSVLEMNISIRMEGGTKVEIRDMKRDATTDKPQPGVASATPNLNCHTSNNKHGTIIRRGKRVLTGRSLFGREETRASSVRKEVVMTPANRRCIPAIAIATVPSIPSKQGL